jgi:hypothetical protein
VSLSENLSNLVASRGNWGCVTCLWLEKLSKEDRGAFDDWVTKKLSLVQLWDACALENPPLKVSISGLRNHIRHHQTL